MTSAISLSQIKPMPGYILVQPAESSDTTETGIYLGSGTKEELPWGSVVLVGPDRVDEKGNPVTAPAKKGQIVIFRKNIEDESMTGGSENKKNTKSTGVRFKIGKTNYQFYKFEDIIAIIDSK